MPLPPDLITEETIATLYDHLKGAADTANVLLQNPQLSKVERDRLESIKYGWVYCQKGLLNGQVPERER